MIGVVLTQQLKGAGKPCPWMDGEQGKRSPSREGMLLRLNQGGDPDTCCSSAEPQDVMLREKADSKGHALCASTGLEVPGDVGATETGGTGEVIHPLGRGDVHRSHSVTGKQEIGELAEDGDRGLDRWPRRRWTSPFTFHAETI